MRRHRGILTVAVVVALQSSAALAQSTTTSGTTSTASTTTTSSPTTTTQSAFDKLSPGGQKIALALCGAQAGGCPTGQSSAPSSSTSTAATATSSKTLTLDQIAQMKQHQGWGEMFKAMQKSGQIPADVKNLGQLVSGRYQAQSSGTTITTASGKTQVVGGSGSSGSSGSQFGKSQAGDNGSGSNAGGVSSSAGSHSAAGSHGGGHGK
jgi:hypothetical protein